MSETVQLMLVVPCSQQAETPLAAALEQVGAACVLIVPTAWQPTALDAEKVFEIQTEIASFDHGQCRKLVELIQAKGSAALIAGDAATAQAIGADGIHLDTTETLDDAYQNARSFLGPDAIIGVMPGTSRHTAMTLAEANADYVGYPVTTGDHHDPGLKFIAWWAEIFESPVVAFAPVDLDVCRRIIEAGPPDFIAVELPIDNPIDQLAALATLCAEEGQLPIADKNAK